MKREFGRKLIEEHLVRLDLTLLIDTSGAYIPGHGTPTVILVGRSREPIAPTVRTVMGIRGEPATPADPSRGVVWSAILDQVDRPGSESGYVTVEDVPRERYAKHPWSIGGGGASDLLARISADGGQFRAEIGRTTHTGLDDVYYASEHSLRSRNLREGSVPLVIGEDVRDFIVSPSTWTLFPYDSEGYPRQLTVPELRHFWGYRTVLRNRMDFGQLPEERGLRWFDHSMFFGERFRAPLSLTFAFVTTHNHFILDRGAKVFNRSAPVIKLPSGSSEADYLGVFGLLNSSTSCFWFKQVCHNKGSSVDQRGARQRTAPFEDFFELSGTKVGEFPLPDGRPLIRAHRLDELAGELAASLPGAVEPSRAPLTAARKRAEAVRAEMIALQEELDWEVYDLYGVLDGNLTHPAPPPLRLGERAFEILLARRVAAGEEQTTWFERHGSTPITELPADWPADYRTLVERRIELIKNDRDLGLIERPEYKRRWQWELWEKQQERELRGWLLDRLEDARYWEGAPRLTSCARLADEARKDVEFRSVAELYVSRPDLDLGSLVEELVAAEAVPYVAALRHTDTGMRTRATWERTWELQRKEDAIDELCELPEDDPRQLSAEQATARKKAEIGTIPVPPRYTSKDYRKTAYWQLRGKLDVPKERFIVYPGCERAVDPSPVIGWVGWNHLERAQALAEHLARMRQDETWDAQRLTPLLAGLAELLPWVRQWHNEHDPSLGRRVGDAYADFLGQQLAELGLTVDDLRSWRPAEPTRGRRPRVAA